MNTMTDSAFARAAQSHQARLRKVTGFLNALFPIGGLLLRLWVAHAFWVSGITKIQSWDSTLYLFQEEYSVPLLPPEFAAYLGSAVELGFPVLLALGVLGRFAAGVLFIFNIVAVISYPDLNAAGLEQHKVWGIMLLVSLLHGPGKLSVDYWISRRFFQEDR